MSRAADQTMTPEGRTANRPRRFIVHRSSFIVCLLCGLCASASAQLSPPDSGKDCAVCHLEWTEGFNRITGILLLDAPPKPAAAESDTCLGCHDGSVADSRRLVWLDHGHKTGVTPSAGMKVPDQLPLEDGKLACRTCHTAHAADSRATLKDAVFLRIKNDTGQLCNSCHADKTEGPERGTHPLGPLAFSLPRPLANAGSHAGPDGKQVVCLTCHTSHGSRQDHLLVMPADTSTLCLTCHEKTRPAMFRVDAAHEHPQNPPLRTAAHRQAIKDMGTRAGPDDTMVCLSCHKLHHGQSGKAMLADTLQESHLCTRCHPDRQPLAGSSHDLRQSAPQELNSRGQTPQQSGPCGACHTFHSYARKPTPQNGDPQGLCTTCHSDNQVAAKHTGLPFSHPPDLNPARLPKDLKLALFPSPTDPQKKAIACLTCHDPHRTTHPSFLRTTGDDLCANCHAAKVLAMAGPHDFSRKGRQRNAQNHTGAETGKCGFCHAVHNANGPSMWVATKTTPSNPDALCTECHRSGGMAGDKRASRFKHPTGPDAKLKDQTLKVAFPLYDPQSHMTSDGFVACGSCHDIHQDRKQSRAFLRTSATSDLCVTCHPAQAQMANSSHDSRNSTKPWPGNQRTKDLCTSCHKPHSNDPARKTWAVAPAPGLAAADANCVSCHPDQTWSAADRPAKPGLMMHPQTIAADSPIRQLPISFPLQPPKNPNTLSCQTCHNPHSAPNSQFLLRTQLNAPAAAVCLSCHPEPKFIEKSMHSREFLDPDGKNSRACSPCHATHALQGSAKTLLWAAPLEPQGATPSERLCLGCHSAQGGAKSPTVIQHPATAMQKLAAATTQPTELQKKMALIREITCSTCHLPHGREMDLPETLPATRPIARTMLSAIKPMLRPDVDRNLCATCHGIDATRVYLYFHNPKKREQVQKYIEQ